MKNPTLLILFAVLVPLLSYQCSNEKAVQGTVIQGNIKNANNLQVFLDKVVVNQTNNVLEKAVADASGRFEMAFPEGLEAGIYRLRIGAKKINLVFDGTEGLVTLEGDLSTLQAYNFDLKGSKSSTIYVNTMVDLIAKKLNAADIQTYVDTVSNPMVGMFISYQSLGPNGQFLQTHKSALTKLQQALPEAENTKGFAAFVGNTEAAYAQQRSSELIQIGQPAPDIRLPNPNGKEMALSDLKGKVVLLDFWASWCGPCRKENPNVVEVYNRYKDKGFTVFSVSLDGLDSRTRARFTSQEQIDEQLERSKERWVKAIEQDNLPWEYHVSDLKKWECAPARTYGVRSIPRTFLLDREGNIAAVNLRGAQAIEQELLKIL